MQGSQRYPLLLQSPDWNANELLPVLPVLLSQQVPQHSPPLSSLQIETPHYHSIITVKGFQSAQKTHAPTACKWACHESPNSEAMPTAAKKQCEYILNSSI